VLLLQLQEGKDSITLAVFALSKSL